MTKEIKNSICLFYNLPLVLFATKLLQIVQQSDDAIKFALLKRNINTLHI